MSEVLSRFVSNTISHGASSSTTSTKTSRITFENDVKVTNVQITYSYNQSGYSGGNGSTLDSTLNFYDKNNVLLHTIIPQAIHNTEHNVDVSKSYNVKVDIKNVRYITLVSTGKNSGGHCSHTAIISYINDFTSEMIKKAVLDTIKSNELFKRIITAKIEEE